MSLPTPPPPERLLELLAGRALAALDANEERELRSLLASHPEVDPTTYDLTAALVYQTRPDDPETLPAALRRKLEEQAEAFFEPDGDHAPPRLLPIRTRNSRERWFLWSGWAAAAACVLCATGLWIHVSSRRTPSPSERQASLLASNVKLVRAKGTDPAKKLDAAGEIIWSGSRQEGYINLKGLPINDPKNSQYQLWIFDRERDERHPVDGGVFDIQATGELVVPITAKLPIGEPVLFAITRERPGGVVVSDRKEIVFLAAVR
jgi:hypothetical protein